MATPESSRRPLGIGLVSVGWMGRVHSTSLARVIYHFPELELEPRLVIAADSLPGRAEFAVRQLGYEGASTDWHDVIAHPDVQAVSITAPNFLHRDVALAAAAAGKHFWIEKPVGRSLQETADIAQAAQRAGVKTAVGFNYRHVPAVEHARELVGSGAIGRPTHVRGVFFNDYAADPRAALSWRFQRALAGAGALGDLLSHVVDLLQYVVGPITEVAGLTSVFTADRPLPPPDATHFTVVESGEMAPVENDDYVAALLRFEAGAVGTCEASRVSVGPRCQVGFEIYGSDGAVAWDFERMNELQVCTGRQSASYGFTRMHMGPGNGELARFQPGPAIAMGYDDLKVIEAARFLTSIAAGTQAGPTVADALTAARVLDAIARAAQSGRWESLGAHGSST